jgi:hypothetical protein
MVDNEIQSHIAKYEVTIKKEAKPSEFGDSVFIEIADAKQELPSIRVHFIKASIYSVAFLSNEFFELPETTLWLVIDLLLQGSYRVDINLFRKKSIKISHGGETILPERIHSGREYKRAYGEVPKRFSER